MTVAAIVACEMLEDEVLLALERVFTTLVRPPVVWLESSLHDRPNRLQDALQRLVDRLDRSAREGRTVAIRGVRPGQGPVEGRQEMVEVSPVGDLTLCFGYCGGGLKGLVSRERRLVFPRADDCISLLLENADACGRQVRDTRAYYLTRGWFCHSSSVSEDMDAMEARYGRERARAMMKLAFANYERVSLIDTGAYPADEWASRSQAYAEKLELEGGVVPGSTSLLERLFKGTWLPGEVVALEPGEAVSLQHIVAAGV